MKVSRRLWTVPSMFSCERKRGAVECNASVATSANCLSAEILPVDHWSWLIERSTPRPANKLNPLFLTLSDRFYTPRIRERTVSTSCTVHYERNHSLKSRRYCGFDPTLPIWKVHIHPLFDRSRVFFLVENSVNKQNRCYLVD